MLNYCCFASFIAFLTIFSWVSLLFQDLFSEEINYLTSSCCLALSLWSLRLHYWRNFSCVNLVAFWLWDSCWIEASAAVAESCYPQSIHQPQWTYFSETLQMWQNWVSSPSCCVMRTCEVVCRFISCSGSSCLVWEMYCVFCYHHQERVFSAALHQCYSGVEYVDR